MLRILAIALAFLATDMGAIAKADEKWRASIVNLSEPVQALRFNGNRAYALTGQRGSLSWIELRGCSDGPICVQAARPPAGPAMPANGLPDGRVAQARTGSPARAWYAEPSDKYRHGILGDRLEPTELVAVTRDGNAHSVSPSAGGVFEDLTPRIADLDGDGTNEIITITSGTGEGASLVIYGMRDDELTLLGATPPVGRTHRWRNPATIADLTGDGALEIAEVVTPHIGGTLNIWSYTAGKLELLASRRGYSNHVIGSRDLALSAAFDPRGGGPNALALPTADRATLEIVTYDAGRIATLAQIAMPARIDKAVGTLNGPTGPIVIAGLEDGRLVAVSGAAATYCITNRDDEKLLIVTERENGDRDLRYTAAGERWCVPRRALRAVWVFTDEKALEGCSRLVGEESGLVLDSYTAFDNCAWTRVK